MNGNETKKPAMKPGNDLPQNSSIPPPQKAQCRMQEELGPPPKAVRPFVTPHRYVLRQLVDSTLSTTGHLEKHNRLRRREPEESRKYSIRVHSLLLAGPPLCRGLLLAGPRLRHGGRAGSRLLHVLSRRLIVGQSLALSRVPRAHAWYPGIRHTAGLDLAAAAGVAHLGS